MKNIMPTKFLAAVFVLLSLSIAKAENHEPKILYPILTATAASLDDFAPSGWKLEHKMESDLNSDGFTDAVLVIRKIYDTDDPDNPTLNDTPFDAMHRILLVVFEKPKKLEGNEYRLAFHNNTLIPTRNTPDLEEYLSPVDPLEYAPKGFTIHFDLFYSAGSWEIEQRRFQFVYRDETFKLAVFERDTTHRSSGKTNGVLVDYDKQRANLTTGNIADDEPSVAFKKFDIPKLFELTEIKDAFDFDPFSGDLSR